MRGADARRRVALRAALREARPLLELNRTPARALVVIVLAGMALLAASGAFEIRAAAAQRDLPVPAHAEPTPDLPPFATPDPEAESQSVEPADPGTGGPQPAPLESAEPSAGP